MRTLRAAAAIFTAACGFVTLTAANPFNRPYVFGIEHITSEGDLSLALPLTRVALDSETYINLTLTHKMEVVEYGAVRSTFILNPLRTGIYLKDLNTWRWLRPGGGEVLFRIPESVSPEVTELAPTLHFQDCTERPEQAMQGTGGALFVYKSGWQIVRDNKWELRYFKGSLKLIESPNKKRWNVTSTGAHLVSIDDGAHILLTARWSDSLDLQHVQTANGEFAFKEENNQLVSVERDGKTCYNIEYDTHGLIRSMKGGNDDTQIYKWKPIASYTCGDTNYYLPYHLASVGSMTYKYIIKDSKILLSMGDSNKMVNMVIVTRHGHLISVNYK